MTILLLQILVRCIEVVVVCYNNIIVATLPNLRTTLHETSACFFFYFVFLKVMIKTGRRRRLLNIMSLFISSCVNRVVKYDLLNLSRGNSPNLRFSRACLIN